MKKNYKNRNTGFIRTPTSASHFFAISTVLANFCYTKNIFNKDKSGYARKKMPKLVCGFTLIETLLYLSLTAIMVVAVSSFFLIVQRDKVKNQAISTVNNQGAFIIEKINRAIRESTGVTTPAAGTPGPILELSMSDPTKDPTTFSVGNGILNMTEGSSDAEPLTDSRVALASSDSSSGYSLNFDGADGSYASLPDNIVQSSNEFTFSAWIYWNTDSTWQRIFDFGTGTDVYMFLTPHGAPFGVEHGIEFAITTTGNGGEQMVYTDSNLATGSWQHVAVTLNGLVGTIYLNGSPVASESISLVPSSLGGTNQNFLGKSQWPDPYFDGYIDEPAIFNRALSDGEISSIYNSGIGVYGDINNAPFNDGLVAGYHFDENSDTTLLDYSGNGNNGAINGAVTWIANNIPLDQFFYVSPANVVSYIFILTAVSNSTSQEYNYSQTFSGGATPRVTQ